MYYYHQLFIHKQRETGAQIKKFPAEILRRELLLLSSGNEPLTANGTFNPKITAFTTDRSSEFYEATLFSLYD